MAGVHLAARLTGRRKAPDVVAAAAAAGINVEAFDRHAYIHRKSASAGLLFGYGMIGLDDIDPAIRKLARLLV